MGNESRNKWHIRGPQKDIDEIIKDAGSCGNLRIIRRGPNCVVIYNKLREISLWNYSVDLLREHKECWISNDFIREFSDVGGLWVGFYKDGIECIRSWIDTEEGRFVDSQEWKQLSKEFMISGVKKLKSEYLIHFTNPPKVYMDGKNRRFFSFINGKRVNVWYTQTLTDLRNNYQYSKLNRRLDVDIILQKYYHKISFFGPAKDITLVEANLREGCGFKEKALPSMIGNTGLLMRVWPNFLKDEIYETITFSKIERADDNTLKAEFELNKGIPGFRTLMTLLSDYPSCRLVIDYRTEYGICNLFVARMTHTGSIYIQFEYWETLAEGWSTHSVDFSKPTDFGGFSHTLDSLQSVKLENLSPDVFKTEIINYKLEVHGLESVIAELSSLFFGKDVIATKGPRGSTVLRFITKTTSPFPFLTQLRARFLPLFIEGEFWDEFGHRAIICDGQFPGYLGYSIESTGD
jgi:hypothetical protein